MIMTEAAKIADKAVDGELMRLSLELEPLLAAWIEMKRQYAERCAAIDAAIKEATGVSDEDAIKYGAQSIGIAFGHLVSPDVRRYNAIRRQIVNRFPEIGDDEWQRVTAPLEIVVEQVLSIRPETFVGLGVHARAIQYIFVDQDFHPSGEEYSRLRQFLADAMRLAGLPGPMVASSNLDAGATAFTKLFGERLAAKTYKYERDWWEANKKWDARNQHWYAGGMSDSDDKEKRRKWAEEARREAKFGRPRSIGPSPPRQGELPLDPAPAS
jgi:hypothetical protein